MSDRIVKLVFLRLNERKCVVPLVEGCDFEQFLHRVRRRLGLPDHAAPTLADVATGTVDSIDRLDAFSEEAEDLQTILADARQLTIDGDGRVMMPQDLLDYAGVSDTVMFVGLGKSFQLWQPDAYEAHRTEKRQRARDRGITLPMVGRGRDT